MTDRTLRLSEVFGPTFQGEGPSAGRRAWFVRTSGCNLDCAWCDTPYTWDWVRFDRAAETQVTPTTAAVSLLRGLGWAPGDLLVVTGGEPCVQGRDVNDLLDTLNVMSGFRGRPVVEVETNGTIRPDRTLGGWVPAVLRFVVSPKLPSSGVDKTKAWRPPILSWFLERESTVLKVVASDRSDLAALRAWLLDLDVPPGRVWVQPQGATTEEWLSTARMLAGMILDNGWNLSARVHTLLWDGERGR